MLQESPRLELGEGPLQLPERFGEADFTWAEMKKLVGAEVISSLRQTSCTGVPASACRRAGRSVLHGIGSCA
jgi:hypothetical protein